MCVDTYWQLNCCWTSDQRSKTCTKKQWKHDTSWLVVVFFLPSSARCGMVGPTVVVIDGWLRAVVPISSAMCYVVVVYTIASVPMPSSYPVLLHYERFSKTFPQKGPPPFSKCLKRAFHEMSNNFSRREEVRLYATTSTNQIMLSVSLSFSSIRQSVSQSCHVMPSRWVVVAVAGIHWKKSVTGMRSPWK